MTIQQIIKYSIAYEDGETGTNACIDQFCQAHGLNAETAELAKKEAFKQGALEAGIPISVIEGKTKLSDHFSETYINNQCNKKE